MQRPLPVEDSITKSEDQKRLDDAVAVLTQARLRLEALLSCCWYRETEEAIQQVVDSWPDDTDLLNLDLDAVEDF